MERIEVCCPQSGGEEHFSGCLICGADMPLCKLGCKYTALNRECIGGDCSYFQKQTAAA